MTPTNTPETVERLEQARAVYIEYAKRRTVLAGDDVNDEWVSGVRAGEADDTHGVQIALLALSAPSPASGEAMREALEKIAKGKFVGKAFFGSPYRHWSGSEAAQIAAEVLK